MIQRKTNLSAEMNAALDEWEQARAGFLEQLTKREFKMGELEAIRESMRELEGLTKEALLQALFACHRELTQAEKTRFQWQQSHTVTNNMLDLYKRRADLAAAICRDDEGGLGREHLDRIAEVIWPTVPDVTAIPTGVILTTKGDRDDWITLANEAEWLIGAAEGLLAAIKSGLPEGFNLGEATTKTLEQWTERSKTWLSQRVKVGL